MTLRQGVKLLNRLRRNDAQLAITGVIERPMKSPQRLLEGHLGHRQAVAITRLKHRTSMPIRQHLPQRGTEQGIGILTTGHKFRMHHFTLADLVNLRQNRLGNHIQQPCQRAVQRRRRYFTEIFAVTRLRGRIHVPATGLHKRHQALLSGESFTAKKQQMLEKVGQSRISQRLVMTAGIDTQTQRCMA